MNNAGIPGRNFLFHEMPMDEWKQMIAVNLTGVFLA